MNDVFNVICDDDHQLYLVAQSRVGWRAESSLSTPGISSLDATNRRTNPNRRGPPGGCETAYHVMNATLGPAIMASDLCFTDLFGAGTDNQLKE
jgi:hypothetical protein